MSYRIQSIYPTIELGGFWAGTPMVAVDFGVSTDAPDIRDLAALEVAEACLRVRGERPSTRTALFCGVEPLLEMDAALVEALAGAGFMTVLETSGAVSLSGRGFTFGGVLPDWIVATPFEPAPRIEVIDELRITLKENLYISGLSEEKFLSQWKSRVVSSMRGRASMSGRMPNYASEPALFVQFENSYVEPLIEHEWEAVAGFIDANPGFRFRVRRDPVHLRKEEQWESNKQPR